MKSRNKCKNPIYMNYNNYNILKPYLKVLKRNKTVYIPPHLLANDLKKTIKRNLWSNIKYVSNKECGYILELLNIENIEDGSIEPRTGNVIFEVTYNICSLLLENFDVIWATVVNVTKIGFDATLGPFVVHVPRRYFEDQYKYECDHTILYEQYVSLHSHNIFPVIKNGIKIKIKLHDVSVIHEEYDNITSPIKIQNDKDNTRSWPWYSSLKAIGSIMYKEDVKNIQNNNILSGLSENITTVFE